MGLTEEVIEKMKADVQEFFKLPPKEKNEYAGIPNGNGVEGYGQHTLLFPKTRSLIGVIDFLKDI